MERLALVYINNSLNLIGSERSLGIQFKGSYNNTRAYYNKTVCDSANIKHRYGTN